MPARLFVAAIFASVALLLAAKCCAAVTVTDTATTATAVLLVDVTSASTPNAVLLAVQAAAGLANRQGPNVYVLQDADDIAWLDLILEPQNVTFANVSAMDFLNSSLATYGAILCDISAVAVLPSVGLTILSF